MNARIMTIAPNDEVGSVIVMRWLDSLTHHCQPPEPFEAFLLAQQLC